MTTRGGLLLDRMLFQSYCDFSLWGYSYQKKLVLVARTSDYKLDIFHSLCIFCNKHTTPQ